MTRVADSLSLARSAQRRVPLRAAPVRGTHPPTWTPRRGIGLIRCVACGRWLDRTATGILRRRAEGSARSGRMPYAVCTSSAHLGRRSRFVPRWSSQSDHARVRLVGGTVTRRIEVALHKPRLALYARIKPTLVIAGRGHPVQWGLGTWQVPSDQTVIIRVFLFNRLWRFGQAEFALEPAHAPSLVYRAPVLPFLRGRIHVQSSGNAPA